MKAAVKIKNVLMGLAIAAMLYVWVVIMFILDSEFSNF